MRILFFTAEQWPTYRADVVTLFGKYLPKNNVSSDLVTAQDYKVDATPDWPSGKTFLVKIPQNRAAQYIVKFLHQIKSLIMVSMKPYDAIQVRDMVVIAVFALLKAKLTAKPFYYWLSFPHSEDQICRAKNRGLKAGIRYWFPLIQGTIGQCLLYRVVLPNANHIFVQSQKMLEAIQQKGIDATKMTPVPMGVDVELASNDIEPINLAEFKNKRVIVYLGTLDPSRQIEVLLRMVKLLKQTYPEILLLLVGDTVHKTYKARLLQEAKEMGITDNLFWTGWVSTDIAWRYLKVAEVGLSPIPRNSIFDMGSPTKAVEYMALGIPVVVNDNPDQEKVVIESGAGLCVSLTSDNFAMATQKLLGSIKLRSEMTKKGQQYIREVRGYDQIGRKVAKVYMNLAGDN